MSTLGDILDREPTGFDMLRHYLRAFYMLGCQLVCIYWFVMAIRGSSAGAVENMRFFGSMTLYWLIEIAYQLEEARWDRKYGQG
jgi:hypothetical protein